MIVSFASRETERIWEDGHSKRYPPDIHRRALMKLFMIQRAKDLNDLTVPPANQLEALKHDRKGQHSIRINRQWRICFRWQDGNAYDVEIVDYH